MTSSTLTGSPLAMGTTRSVPGRMYCSTASAVVGSGAFIRHEYRPRANVDNGFRGFRGFRGFGGSSGIYRPHLLVGVGDGTQAAAAAVASRPSDNVAGGDGRVGRRCFEAARRLGSGVGGRTDVGLLAPNVGLHRAALSQANASHGALYRPGGTSREGSPGPRARGGCSGVAPVTRIHVCLWGHPCDG